MSDRIQFCGKHLRQKPSLNENKVMEEMEDEDEQEEMENSEREKEVVEEEACGMINLSEYILSDDKKKHLDHEHLMVLNSWTICIKNIKMLRWTKILKSM